MPLSSLYETPTNILKILYWPKVGSLGYIFAADNVDLSSFKFLWWALKTHVFLNRMSNGNSRSSKVADCGTNRKRVCDYLLVVNSNRGPTLYLAWFQSLCRFSAENSDPTPIRPEFCWCSPWTRLSMLVHPEQRP